MAKHFKVIDSLGRVVIPRNIRENLGLRPGSEVQIQQVGGDVVISCSSGIGYQLACIVEQLESHPHKERMAQLIDELLKLEALKNNVEFEWSET